MSADGAILEQELRGAILRPFECSTKTWEQFADEVR
jgi:hypothetical protein